MALVLLLLLIGSSTWAYATSQELALTRDSLRSSETDLATTRGDLSTTQVSLTTASNDLKTTTQSLSREQASRATADAKVATLQRQVAAQVGCIQALMADSQELEQVRGLVSDNYNRTATGSIWANASSARYAALRTALDNYYQAFSTAYDGFRSAANGWVDLGNRQISLAASQATIMNSEIAKVNVANSQIDAALAAFRVRQRNTNATCQF